jgi:NADPH2:quinone reductase
MTKFTQDMALTQYVEAGGIRFAYRRFGIPGHLPLVPGDRIASTLGWSDDQLNGCAVEVTPVTALPVSRILGRLAADVVNGQLAVPVQRTYALADVPQALADFAAGTRGKLAISVP